MESFHAFCDRKTREAASPRLVPLETFENHSAAFATQVIGNSWTRQYYDGPFHLPVYGTSVPFVSLVFVQSKGRNTVTDNPEDLGGGPLDKHLLYEGLSRVGVDAVLAGAKTAEGENTFFSVWHPELVALRRELGLPRHPAQIVVTGKGLRGASGSERGVLKREVPRWLGMPEFRDLVVGFEVASIAHGGEGALYVRVRRGQM